MDDPLMLAAATTVVTWATTEVAQGARTALADLTRLLRRRFRHEPSASQAVDVALRQPTPEAVRRFAALLQEEASRDPAFDAAFRERFARVEAALTANPGDVTNTVFGDVGGSAVQARDVHGGITFGNRHGSS
ncbi:hypothetical protein [Micromonospora sp. NPDC049240]|uniref:hypothetical protein n=1 Tax=Micromonospora sp. NPDC049240 TaxID=3155151 RepID=UPI0033FF7B5A